MKENARGIGCGEESCISCTHSDTSLFERDRMINALIGHLVGDFILQNDWMALNKKKSTYHCAVHCLIWTASVALMCGQFGMVGIALLFVTHFIQDRTNAISNWMELVGQKQFRDGPCAPWSSIVVDQAFHLVTIWLILRWGL